MDNLYWLSTLLVFAIVIVNIIAGLFILWELVTGSYKKYIDKREYHLEQLRRIEQQLRRGDKND
jgi:hypothetical protein